MTSHAGSSQGAERDRVLIVTYLFPPSGGVGVPRFVNYAKHLPKHGCDVHILTVRKPATPVYDPELAKQVPPATHVFRAFNPEVPYALRDRLWKRIAGNPKAPAAQAKSSGGIKGIAKSIIQRVFCPDVQVLWTPFAIRKMRRIVRDRRITTVLVNLPPYSCLKIAADVKRQFPHVKLILDFRDEWIENYFTDFDSAASEYKLRMARELEREAVVRADYVSAVTESQRRQIRDRYPDQPESKFLYMPNGYDPDIYGKLEPRPHTPGKMVITYFGTLYDNPAYRPVFEFLDALEDLPAEIRGVIEVWFIGRISKEAVPLLDGRKTAIRCLGFMPQVKALEYLARSDYNLMVGGNPTTHAGKLFDYLASGKPMIGVCHSHSEIAKLIRETRSGVTVELGDREGAVRMVREAFQRAENEPPPTPDWDAIRFFEWPSLIGRMARLTRIGDYRTLP